MSPNWQDAALAEIRSIKPSWSTRYGWRPHMAPAGPDEDGTIEFVDLFVRFTGKKTGDRDFMLRLRYKPDFATAGRSESFVNPQRPLEEGLSFWPRDVSGINPTHTPPFICLEGTWGFHSLHHKERDGRAARINKLLFEIQRCLDGKA